jgi:molybdopterin-guanine dinucleotide biosynthesis protein A
LSDSPRRPNSAEAAFVLAGGQSSRMGADKALVQFAGRPLVVCAVEILRGAGLEAAIAGSRPDLSSYAPIITDAEPGLGPLGGICAALVSTPVDLAIFLSVDQPLLPQSLIRYLLNHACISGRAVTLVAVNGFPQTFPVVIERSALPALQQELSAGRRGCYSAFVAAAAYLGQPVTVLPLEFLVQTGHVSDPTGLPAVHWFLNLNTPRDLELASAHLLRKSRVS